MVSIRLLILQVATIVVVSRLIGWLFRRLQQPHVVGEMLAGILLGPSLLGWLAPRISAGLFPPDSLGNLNALSQIGLLLFMFLVGLELDLTHLRELGRAAVITSQVSIVVPFALGVVLAHFLYVEFSNLNVEFHRLCTVYGRCNEHHGLSSARANPSRAEYAWDPGGSNSDRVRRCQ